MRDSRAMFRMRLGFYIRVGAGVQYPMALQVSVINGRGVGLRVRGVVGFMWLRVWGVAPWDCCAVGGHESCRP